MLLRDTSQVIRLINESLSNHDSSSIITQTAEYQHTRWICVKLNWGSCDLNFCLEPINPVKAAFHLDHTSSAFTGKTHVNRAFNSNTHHLFLHHISSDLPPGDVSVLVWTWNTERLPRCGRVFLHWGFAVFMFAARGPAPLNDSNRSGVWWIENPNSVWQRLNKLSDTAETLRSECSAAYLMSAHYNGKDLAPRDAETRSLLGS